jgi:ergothioneine biosynthesis protein EgtB
MARTLLDTHLRWRLLSHLRNARTLTDDLFQLVQPDALYDRPIPERHRIVFYLGHLEAFDWNLICKDSFGMDSIQKGFDHLFAFGIDPTSGGLPDDKPGDWPNEREILRYNRNVRDAVDRCLDRASDGKIFWVAIEHRLMHAETLTYMLHWLSISKKQSEIFSVETDARPVSHEQVEIPSGGATLGISRDSGLFGWDNEFEAHRVHVPAFSIDLHKVTNRDFAEFVQAGGYQEPSLWSAEGWRWISGCDIQHPKFWIRRGNGWLYRTMFADVPLPLSWPVYVSHAEADAYARWKGKSLPTEAQFHRAAFGTPDGSERLYPWGNARPGRHHGNFGFYRWNPTRVDAHPAGQSAFGVNVLVGNGWEWTCTPFGPFPGFEPFAFYPGYSANFFDGSHYVMKGASSRTASLLMRRSFRNWFQPLYPNIYSGFRCVEN